MTHLSEYRHTAEQKTQIAECAAFFTANHGMTHAKAVTILKSKGYAIQAINAALTSETPKETT